MKLSKTILMAGVIGLGMASMASAQTYIRFTGSSAFRATMHGAIQASLDAGYTYAYTESAANGLGKGSQAIFHGTINSGANEVYIKTSWTGSEAGIQVVGQGSTTKFLPDTTSMTSGGNALGTAAASTCVQETANIALSDTLQSTSQFSDTATYQLTEVANGTVGIVPFVWCASKGAAALMTSGSNIYTWQIKNLISTGYIPGAMLSGNSADQGKKIYALGRNPDSGTRLIAFAESGLGALYKTAHQYAPLSTNATGTTTLITGGTSTIARIHQWPVESINGISTKTAGNSGYDSGGNLAYAIGSDDSSFKVAAASTTSVATVNAQAAVTNGGFIAYISVSDASGKAYGSGKSGQVLSYNGAAYSVAAVQEGLYPFWSYEHMYVNNTAWANSTIQSYANNVAGLLQNATTSSTPAVTIPLASMHVYRDSTKDASAITQNY